MWSVRTHIARFNSHAVQHTLCNHAATPGTDQETWCTPGRCTPDVSHACSEHTLARRVCTMCSIRSEGWLMQLNNTQDPVSRVGKFRQAIAHRTSSESHHSPQNKSEHRPKPRQPAARRLSEHTVSKTSPSGLGHGMGVGGQNARHCRGGHTQPLFRGGELISWSCRGPCEGYQQHTSIEFDECIDGLPFGITCVKFTRTWH